MIEVVTILILVVGAMFVFQKYVAQGIYGRWKGVGDSWSHGRQYDKEKTTECIYNIWGNSAEWYDAVCFDEICLDQCVGATTTKAGCDACLNTNCRSDVDGVDVCNE